MIEARTFVEAAAERGFSRYVGVPCSYLTPFINYVINDPGLDYVSSANEGDAAATAAGLATGGERAIVMLQNSGLGNAVNPLTSLAMVFDVPMLLIVTHRGKPDQKDEPQHQLMGRITTNLFELMEIPWAPFPARAQEVPAALDRADRFLRERQQPYALLMERDTVSPHPLEGEAVPSRAGAACRRQRFPGGEDAELVSRQAALREIVRCAPLENAVVIATTGYTGRALYALEDRNNQLYLAGSMGCASAFALGLARAHPDLATVVIDGDGAALMRLGNFATLGSYGADNLAHILLDNEMHESTGGQATTAANVEFADLAAACGYGLAFSGRNPALIGAACTADGVNGARFAHLKTAPGTPADLPRPQIAPRDALRRLMAHIGAAF